MAISRDLFLSILALDSYNRGYGAGKTIIGNDALGTKLGTAEIIKRSGSADPADKGFYGIAYSWNGEKVISYRGTDNYGFSNDPVAGVTDLLNGWVAGAGNDHVQVGAVRLKSANDNTAAFLCRYVG